MSASIPGVTQVQHSLEQGTRERVLREAALVHFLPALLHRWNNAWGVVLGMSELLLAAQASPAPAELGRLYLASVREQAQRGSELQHWLGRFLAGPQGVQSAFDLAALGRQAVGFAEQLYGASLPVGLVLEQTGTIARGDAGRASSLLLLMLREVLPDFGAQVTGPAPRLHVRVGLRPGGCLAQLCALGSPSQAGFPQRWCVLAESAAADGARLQLWSRAGWVGARLWYPAQAPYSD